jgi:hypothetical protein
MEFDCRSVATEQIDRNDTTFRLEARDPADIGTLELGMLQLVHPPILLPTGERHIIISGFDVVDAGLSKGRKAVRCRVLPAETPFLECARIAVACCTSRKRMDITETARAVALLCRFSEDADRVSELANGCGIAVNAVMVEKLLNVNQMPDHLKQGLSEGTIALPVALMLADDGDPEKSDRLSSLFQKLGMSLNRQRELLEWVNAICRLENLTASQLLDTPDLKAIWNDGDLDHRQKASKVRSYLRQRRFPEITRFEGQYHAILKSLKLKKGTQLLPPAHFEGNTYCLKIEFDSHAALLEKSKEFNNIINSKEIRNIWKLM